jgi:acetyl-CoA carboxylase biotin carboxyl carrier protein
VADDANNKPSPFDVGTIKNLVALMSRHDLSEIDLSIGDQRIRLRRGPRVAAAPVAFPSATISPTPTQTPVAPLSPAPISKEKPTRALIEIKSETPGTFYAKSKPDAPQPFVTVGSRVQPDTVVCIIEAMKILNEVTAGCTGVIAEILVENGQPVEFGQVMFRVDPTG